MAEVIVLCDRKSIYTKIQVFFGFLVVLHSSRASQLSQSSLHPTGLIAATSEHKENDVKFSRILASHRPIDQPGNCITQNYMITSKLFGNSNLIS
jgi:hypothetical protein